MCARPCLLFALLAPANAVIFNNWTLTNLTSTSWPSYIWPLNAPPSTPTITWPAVCGTDYTEVHSFTDEDRARLDRDSMMIEGQQVGYDYHGSCPNLDTLNLTYGPTAPEDVLAPAGGSDACGDAGSGEAEPGSGLCSPPMPPSAPAPPRIPEGHLGCSVGTTYEEYLFDIRMLPLWVVVAIYMFYGMAHVCEDFMVPALNILCERTGIPEDVAGATLLAAGCNAPELFASVIGCFLQHSTVGADTVVGSAPFNLMCICGGAAIAVKGNLKLDPWLMVREVGALFIALVLFVIVMQDSMVQATDARNSGAVLAQFLAQFWWRNSR